MFQFPGTARIVLSLDVSTGVGVGFLKFPFG